MTGLCAHTNKHTHTPTNKHTSNERIISAIHFVHLAEIKIQRYKEIERKQYPAPGTYRGRGKYQTGVYSRISTRRLTPSANDVQSIADGVSRRVEILLHRFDVRWSRSQGQWCLLLWLYSSITAVACYKRQVSDGEFVLSAKQCPSVRTR